MMERFIESVKIITWHIETINATSYGLLPHFAILVYLMGFYCEFLFRSLVRINRWREIILFPVTNQV